MSIAEPKFYFRDRALAPIWDKVAAGKRLDMADGLAMLTTADLGSLGKMANWVAEGRHGNTVNYVLNRQLNPTNLCVLDCKFCEYYRKPGEEGAWEMDMPEILEHGKGDISEIHIVGGLLTKWKFYEYLDIVKNLRAAYPKLCIKSWTAVEIDWFAKLEKTDYRTILQELQKAGLDALPGGGAEVFSERVKYELFRPKIGWEKWRDVHRAAHELGIRSNATLLYGHIETYEERVDHMLKLRQLEDESPGFMAFIPLTFLPGNTGIPVNRQGALEDARTIATARLMLDNFPHIKAYWVMMGAEMASIALNFGATDMDGTIGKEKIVHMAGATSPEGLALSGMRQLIEENGKTAQERDIFYNPVVPPEPAAV
jgi:aminodeoxyfutalosine synthase